MYFCGETRKMLPFTLVSIVLSIFFRKAFSIRCFILNGIIDLWLTISYQKPFVVSVPSL